MKWSEFYEGIKKALKSVEFSVNIHNTPIPSSQNAVKNLPQRPVSTVVYKSSSEVPTPSIPLSDNNHWSTPEIPTPPNGTKTPKSDVLQLPENPSSVKSLVSNLPTKREKQLTNLIDILKSKYMIEKIPVSPTKPQHLGQQDHIDLCAAATIFDMLRQGVPRDQVVMTYMHFRGNVANNISNMQYFSSHYPAFKETIDLRRFFPEEYFIHQTPQVEQTIGALDLRKGMLIPEFMVAGQHNQIQENKLTITFEQQYTADWYYNKSGNTCPDYIMALPKNIGPYTHMAYDLKIVRKILPGYDLIKGCASQLEEEVLRAQKSLERNLEQLQKIGKFSIEDASMVDNFKEDLTKNMLNYNTHQDVNVFLNTYNSFREKYMELLLIHKIPMTLLGDLTTFDKLSIEPEVTTRFGERFIYNYTNENAPILEAYNKAAKDMNGKIVGVKQLALEYGDSSA